MMRLTVIMVTIYNNHIRNKGRGPARALELYREDLRTVKNGGARGVGPGGGGRGRGRGCGFGVRTMMIMTMMTICYQSDLLLNGTLKRSMRIMGSAALAVRLLNMSFTQKVTLYICPPVLFYRC